VAREKLYEVEVNAATQYLAEQSDESAGRYVFAYTITIHNRGTVAAQLISRHWIITDAQGLVQEVRGLGVVGAQPLLQPARLQYGGASIATPVGTMRGSYQMVARWHALRGADPGIHALRAPGAALSHLRFRDQVNHTMKAASARASAISR
jgi:ApaG protein